MAEISNARVDSFVRSSKVIPILDETILAESKGDEQIINVAETSPELLQHSTIFLGILAVDGGGDEFSGENNPQDKWLPITESRNGTTKTAAFHLLCSGIGFQVLSLPMAFVLLGWLWGILCLSLLFSWQFYTIWLLVNLHEPSPVTGIRYSRFVHLSIVAFGEKLGKLLSIFPTMYQSGGACVLYIIAGGSVIELFFQSICDNNRECNANTLTGAECFLIFIGIAILIALFFPNLNSLASVTLIGSVTALAYCSLLWILSLSKGRTDDHVEKAVVLTGDASGIRDVFTGFGAIALAFRGHNLVLEIQGTLPTNRKQPSCKSMWRGVTISYLLIAMCMYPLAIVGYWAYGNKIPVNGGILGAFTKFHQNTTSKYIIGAIYLMIIINYLCAFQIYAMPTFDNFERIYVTKKSKPCSRWVRSAIKVFFGGLTYLIAVAFPFLPSLGAVIGSIALPLTLAYPCFMWIAIKKPQRFSRTWCFNLGLGYCGVVLCIMVFAAALWSLIVNGLEANFFKPK